MKRGHSDFNESNLSSSSLLLSFDDDDTYSSSIELNVEKEGSTDTSSKRCEQQQTTYSIDDMDDNIIRYIINKCYSSLSHLMQLRLVCKRWRICTQSEETWGVYRSDILSMLPKPIHIKHEKQLMGSADNPPMKTYAIYIYNQLNNSKKLITSRMSTLKRLQKQTPLPSIPIDYVEKQIRYFENLRNEHTFKRRQLLFHKQFKIGYADRLAPITNTNKGQGVDDNGKKRQRQRRLLPLYIGGHLYFVQGADVDDDSNHANSSQETAGDAVPTLMFKEQFTMNGKGRIVVKASEAVDNGIKCVEQDNNNNSNSNDDNTTDYYHHYYHKKKRRCLAFV